MPAATGAVVITGASTGIGRACALWLDRAGHRVFAGVRKPADGEDLRAAASAQLSPVLIDVIKPDTVTEAFRQIGAALGDAPLLGLVNNAGVGMGGPIEFLALDDLRWQIEVNVIGQVAVIQAAMPLLRRGPGRIVNISSVGGKVASPFMGPYNASKFALEGLSDALRMELARWRIHVSIVQPGAIKTPMWDKASVTADQLKAKMPAQSLQLYQADLDAFLAGLERQGRAGVPPEQVARAVEHALMAPRPRTRYPVGTDARMGILLRRLLPDRLMDWLTRKTWQLPPVP